MPDNEPNENLENDITELTNRLKDRVIDLKESIKELDSLIKSNEIVCQHCQQPFPELIKHANPIANGNNIQTKLICPQCGFPNIIKKL
jgi:hypothetical protein